ncbi:MAG: hypothetical protein ACRDRL_03535 [Sciscionella sp.]
MTQLQLLWAWMHARLGNGRDTDDGVDGSDAGFTTLEWVAIAGVVIVAAIVVATILMNEAKTGANNVKVQ